MLLDLGFPLWATTEDEVPLPQVPGLAPGVASDDLLGVAISHPHFDHYGLLARARQGLPVFIGEDAHRILREAAFFSPLAATITPAGFLRNRQAFSLGPFRLTPFLMDHSAYDAYALLVEAGEKRLFYSGDFRAHGRKGGLFEQLVRKPPNKVDTLLLEGTQVGRGGTQRSAPQTEPELEEELLAGFKSTTGASLVCYSAQNIDRLVTVYKAAKRAGRNLVVDLYTATVAQATGNPKIPQTNHKFDKLRVWVTQRQRVQVKESGEFLRVRDLGSHRIYPEQLAPEASRLVITIRTSMIRDLERAACLVGSHCFWSLWPGYLSDPSGKRFQEFLDRHSIPLKIAHTSGHADETTLKRLVDALAPAKVVPIHTENPALFEELFDHAQVQPDGAWWEV